MAGIDWVGIIGHRDLRHAVNVFYRRDPELRSRLNYGQLTLKVHSGAASYSQWPAAPMPTTSNCPASNRSDGQHGGQLLGTALVPEH